LAPVVQVAPPKSAALWPFLNPAIAPDSAGLASP